MGTAAFISLHIPNYAFQTFSAVLPAWNQLTPKVQA
jgi:hypothetical protein